MTLLLQILSWVVFAVVVAWLGWRWLQRSQDDPGRLISKWVITAILFPTAVLAVLWLGPFAGMAILVLCSITMGCLWAPAIGRLIASPLTRLYEGGHMDLEPTPMYSIAEGKRKHGDYDGALRELRRQLDKFPQDFKLQMTMAEIQAVDLLDLISAEQTVQRLVDQPNHPPGEIAIALTWMSDWKLRIGKDREGARQALEEITRRYPDSEPSRLAEQRLAHLPSEQMIWDAAQRPDVHMEPGEQRVGLMLTPLHIAPKETPAPDQAAELVKHLQEFPHDAEARERLATIYAEHYERLDLALDQIEQLIGDSHLPARQVQHWYNLMADWQIRFRADPTAAGAALDRLIEQFPRSAAAENAMKRKARLKLELRSKEKSRVMKLGS